MTDRPTVLLTGASRGTGAETARWLATRGARLALVARDADALSAVAADARRPGAEVVGLPADVTEARAAESIDHKDTEAVAGARKTFPVP